MAELFNDLFGTYFLVGVFSLIMSFALSNSRHNSVSDRICGASVIVLCLSVLAAFITGIIAVWVF